jgi:L-cysteine/cystine lyase
MEEARGVLAALIGGDPDDIVLTSGVREAITIASQLARSIELVELVDPVGGGVRSSEEIAALAARSATPVVVDAGNAVGALAVDVRSFGATFVAFSGQRWLLGPEGTGALWIDRGRMQRAPAGPQMPDADPLPRRSILGLARSVGWLEMYIGLPWIHERMGRLATGLHADLAAVDGVNVLTPAGTTSGILSLDIAGWPAELAADELGSRAFAILGAPPAPEVLRVSFGAFNTEDELNRFVGVVALCAEHTPETMPRRPGLVVLS